MTDRPMRDQRMTAQSWRSVGLRWLKFNLVGGMGIAMQLFVLAVLKTAFRFNYLVATAAAVEAALNLATNACIPASGRSFSPLASSSIWSWSSSCGTGFKP